MFSWPVHHDEDKTYLLISKMSSSVSPPRDSKDLSNYQLYRKHLLMNQEWLSGPSGLAQVPCEASHHFTHIAVYYDSALVSWDSRMLPQRDESFVWYKERGVVGRIKSSYSWNSLRHCNEYIYTRTVYIITVLHNFPDDCSIDCICACACSVLRLFATPWTVTHQAPLSIEVSRQEYWSGLTFPTPGDLPDPGIKPECPESPALAGFFITEPPGKSWLHLLRFKSPNNYSHAIREGLAGFIWSMVRRCGLSCVMIKQVGFKEFGQIFSIRNLL